MIDIKLGLVSDLHLEATSPYTVLAVLDFLKSQAIDLLVNAGDNSSLPPGSVATLLVHELIRRVFPTLPVLTVLGNHDRWLARGTTKVKTWNGETRTVKCLPSLDDWHDNMRACRLAFKGFDVTFLDDLPGPWRHPGWPGLAVIGDSGWYNTTAPVCDYDYLPAGRDGDTRRSIERACRNRLLDKADRLGPTDRLRVCVTHFPIHPTDPNGLDNWRPLPEMDWDYHLGEHLRDDFQVHCFLEGHSHYRKEGPLVFQCGSDYGKPRSLVLHLKGGSDDAISSHVAGQPNV